MTDCVKERGTEFLLEKRLNSQSKIKSIKFLEQRWTHRLHNILTNQLILIERLTII